MTRSNIDSAGSPAMRQTNKEGSITVVIASNPVEAKRVQDQIESQLKNFRFAETEIFSIRLALEEALVNAIKHGNQMDRNKKVQIEYCINFDRFDIHITDEGRGFDPEDVP